MQRCNARPTAQIPGHERERGDCSPSPSPPSPACAATLPPLDGSTATGGAKPLDDRDRPGLLLHAGRVEWGGQAEGGAPQPDRQGQGPRGRPSDRGGEPAPGAGRGQKLGAPLPPDRGAPARGPRAAADARGARAQVRSPFERDVVQHLDSFEALLDYTLFRMGLGTERVHHPVLLSETLCIPSAVRASASELLFEAYGAPAACYGVDALFAYEEALGAARGARAGSVRGAFAGGESGLVVRIGHAASHVVPILDGRPAHAAALRAPTGAGTSTSLLASVLALRYPQHRPALTPARVTYIKERHCRVVSPRSPRPPPPALLQPQAPTSERRESEGEADEGARTVHDSQLHTTLKMLNFTRL